MAFSSNLGEAHIKIKANTDELRRGLEKSKRQVKSSTESMSAMFSRMRLAIAGVALAIGGIGTAALRAAAQLETMSVAFESMLGSSSAANKLLDELKAFSAKTPFQLSDIAQSARQLLAAGTAAGEVSNQLRILGDVAAGANLPLTDMVSIFAKVQNKGKAFTEELLQMSDRGIPILQQLSQELGVTKEEVFKLASEGKISFEVIQKALANMSGEGGIFFDQMTRQSETLAGKWSTLKDNVTLLGAAIGNLFMPIAKKMLEWATVMTQKITALIGKMQKMVTSFKTMLKGTSLDQIQKDFGGTTPMPGGAGFLESLQKEKQKEASNPTSLLHASSAKALASLEMGGNLAPIAATQAITDKIEAAFQDTKAESKSMQSTLVKDLQTVQEKATQTSNKMAMDFQNAFASIGNAIGGSVGGVGGSALSAFLGPVLGAIGGKVGGAVQGFFDAPSISAPSFSGPQFSAPSGGMGGGTVVNQNINVLPDANRVFKEQLVAHLPMIQNAAIQGIDARNQRRGSA